MAEIFVLMERDRKVSDIDAHAATELAGHVADGRCTYATAEEAEEGRRNGDAYDDPGMTRVVGFRVEAFLPKKGKRK